MAVRIRASTPISAGLGSFWRSPFSSRLPESIARKASWPSRTGRRSSSDRNGGSNTRIDAYFSWPGFFLALAFLLSASRIHSTESLLAFANWAPLLFRSEWRFEYAHRRLFQLAWVLSGARLSPLGFQNP